MSAASAGAGVARQFSPRSARVGELKTEFLQGGKGAPLLYLHGLSRPLGWDTDHIGLALHRRVYAPVLPGWKAGCLPSQVTSIQDYARLMLAFLEEEKIEKADLVGHSFGGASAIRASIQHPDKVRRLVVISSPYARSGWYPLAQEGMSRVGASLAEHLMQTPTGKFSTQWPNPQRFSQFLDKFGKMMSEPYDWSADIATLPMPVLLVFADNDSISQQHIAEFFALVGGGIKEPGWLNTQLSKSRLAVVPGYSHYNFITSPEVPQIIGKFLADPLTNPPTGGAAASQVSPAPRRRPKKP